MHLIVIIAFAALLWFNVGSSKNLLNVSPGLSAIIVVGEIILLAFASMWTTRRTLKGLLEDPSDPNEAQYRHHRFSTILQILMVAAFVGNLLLTGWPDLMRNWVGRGLTFGLLDALVLSPFVISMILIWIVQYPADRTIRQLALNPRLTQGQPAHAVWTLRQYLSFNVRFQLLTIAVPMMMIIIGDDIIDHYRGDIKDYVGGLLWVADALMGLLVCLVFLMAPVMLRYIWNTESFPSGPLRSNMERIARQTNLKYRDILLWHSNGMVVNAAVMGVLAPLRYVLISDGLLESMSDKHIEAVFGHEAGHVNCWHIPYFITFATLTMLIAGGLHDLLIYFMKTGLASWLTFDYIQIIVGMVVVGIWGVVFGWLSHQFEHQADLSGAQSITPEASDCHKPCLLHNASPGLPKPEICATAADEFAQALQRVAILNGLPTDEKGWRHPSIKDRIAFLTATSQDLARSQSFVKSIRTVKLVLAVGTLLALVAAGFLYRDQLLPPSFFRIATISK